MSTITEVSDAFVELYDSLERVPGHTLSAWLPAGRQVADGVEREVLREEAVPSWCATRLREWTRKPNEDAFGALLGLYRAILRADPGRDSPHDRRMGRLRARYKRCGRLNKRTGGALVFSRTVPLRPWAENAPDSLVDVVPGISRVSEHTWRRTLFKRVPAAKDLVLKDQSLVVAQLPFLASRDDVEWLRIRDPDGNGVDFYSVKPLGHQLREYVTTALSELDNSGAQLAILPEASLDAELLNAWCEAMRRNPRPASSQLAWVLLGTGPIPNLEGLAPHDSRLPNRAVLVGRTDGSILVSQDKRAGFRLDVEQQRRYGLADVLGCETVLYEYIALGTELFILESVAGRFAIAICEDHGRVLNNAKLLYELAVSHLLVPVIAPAMYSKSWQATSARQLTEEFGIAVYVSNSHAIDRSQPIEYSKADMAAPSAMMVVPPADRDPERYQSAEVILEPADGAYMATDERTDALTPRLLEAKNAFRY